MTVAVQAEDGPTAGVHRASRGLVWFLQSVVAHALMGVGIAMSAWGDGASPALAMLIPLMWSIAPNRMAAWVLATAYHLTVIRFIPDFAATWFDSQQTGFAIWIAQGALCGLGWALAWTSRHGVLPTLLSWALALALTLLPPLGMILPGHPLMTVGYLLPGMGWAGIILYVIGTAGLLLMLRVYLPGRVGQRYPMLQGAAILGLGALLLLAADKPDPEAGRVVGKVGALTTRWGGFPARDSLEVAQRIEKMGRATRSLAGGEGEISTVVFAESVLGIYDPSLYAPLETDVLKDARAAGQTVIVGADLPVAGGILQKAALIFLADGSSAYVVARQPVPFAEWAPWSEKGTYEIDWFSPSVANVGGGVKARVVFCYEEYIPLLHLISEAREEHHMVLVLANLWAAGPLADVIQKAHTEGMARLFRRPWVRAVNFPAVPHDRA